jgi:RNA polymerase sigma-70 factor, ECF subfamily
LSDRRTNHPSADIRDQIVALLPRLRRFCLALAGSAADADDLAQSTVERALSRLDQWQVGTRLDSWMFKIAQNQWIDQVRSRGRRGVTIDLDALADTVGQDGRHIIENRALVARTRRAMLELPEEQRVLVALVLIDGQSYKEASTILDIPIGTVMSRLARARRSLETMVFGGPETQGAQG